MCSARDKVASERLSASPVYEAHLHEQLILYTTGRKIMTQYMPEHVVIHPHIISAGNLCISTPLQIPRHRL